jgi:hypothetical protein
MKKQLLLLFFCGFMSAEAQQLRVSISQKQSGPNRTLIADVAEGSGDYLYTWTCTAMYGISTDKSSRQITVPLDEADITYKVFVRDNKTGTLGYKAINFARSTQPVNLVTFPNPSREIVTLQLQDVEGAAPIEQSKIRKIDIFSEETKKLVKTISLEGKEAVNYSVEVKDLPKGVYYFHVQLHDNIHSQLQEKRVRVLVSGQ